MPVGISGNQFPTTADCCLSIIKSSSRSFVFSCILISEKNSAHDQSVYESLQPTVTSLLATLNNQSVFSMTFHQANVPMAEANFQLIDVEIAHSSGRTLIENFFFVLNNDEQFVRRQD